MHMFRFFCEHHDDHQLLLSADQSRHLLVIRAKIGQTIEVGDGRGNVFVCQLQSIDRQGATCQIVSQRFVPKPTTSLTTMIGVQKHDSFERVLQAITELGSDAIVVFRHNNDAKFKLRLSYQQRWQKIILGAVKQSKRAWLPSLTIAKDWQELLSIISTGKFSCKLLLDSSGNHSLDYLLDRNHSLKTICLINGSSCGFSTNELTDLQTLGAIPITLGTKTLRAETATIFATGFVNFCRHRRVKEQNS